MDVSATGAQTHLRLLQVRQWPWQFAYLRRPAPLVSHAYAAQSIKCAAHARVRPCWGGARDAAGPATADQRRQRSAALASAVRPPRSLPTAASRVLVSYYNTLWLVLNDVIFGIVLGYFVHTHADALGATVGNFVQQFAIDYVEAMVKWLMGWPSGIKLNSNLDAFYGNVCLTSLALWNGEATACVCAGGGRGGGKRVHFPSAMGLASCDPDCVSSMRVRRRRAPRGGGRRSPTLVLGA